MHLSVTDTGAGMGPDISGRISIEEIEAMGIRELLGKPLAPGPLSAAIRRVAAK